jgi:hypothetical protein
MLIWITTRFTEVIVYFCRQNIFYVHISCLLDRSCALSSLPLKFHCLRAVPATRNLAHIETLFRKSAVVPLSFRPCLQFRKTLMHLYFRSLSQYLHLYNDRKCTLCVSDCILRQTVYSCLLLIARNFQERKNQFVLQLKTLDTLLPNFFPNNKKVEPQICNFHPPPSSCLTFRIQIFYRQLDVI